MPASEPLVDRMMWQRLLVMVTASVAAIFGFFVWRLSTGAPFELVRSETFTVLAVCQWFNVLNCRSELKSALNFSIFKNYWLLGGLVLGVAAAVGADLLVVVRSAGSNGMAFIDPIRTPEAWRSELTGDLQLGLVVAGVAWLVVAGLVTVRRRGSDGPEQDRRRRSSAVVATPGLIGAALLVGVWALPALVAEASRTEVVVPAGVQRLAATLHADSVSITPATVHPGPVWITTSTDVPAAAFPDSSLEGPYGPLGDTHLASLAPGPLDPEILGTLPRPGWGAYATTSLGAGRYAWLVTRWQDPQTLILERVAMMVVDSSPAPAIGPPLAPEAPVFEGAMNLILVAAGLAFAAIAAGWRRPGAVPRGQGPRLVNGPRLVLIVLLGGGAPLLLAGLMAFYVELVANPF
ncbi:MAG: cation-translocating P-type ATPase C-terminal domain-containing protein [Chloroflexota bacterium]